MGPMNNPCAVQQTRFGRKRQSSLDRLGLTLVEVAVSTLLVGLVLVGSLKVVGGVLQIRMAAEQIHDGTALAQELMNEILSQHYEEPTELLSFGVELSELGSNRSSWDDVDDYNGLKLNGAQLSGSSPNRYNGFEALVCVAEKEANKLKRITVTVTTPQDESIEFSSVKGNW